jgi:Rieske Fe-S protein
MRAVNDTVFQAARRRALRLLAACGVVAPTLGRGEDPPSDDATAPPRAGDWLVFAFGERAGEAVMPEDLTVGRKQIFAYPQDAATGQVRSANRLNQVLLVRLDPAMLSPETLARSVEGVVGYSGVCSHTGCDVTDWNADARRFQCPCHESQFDPSDSARVVGGPAPWQLAALPLALADGKLAVAAEFVGRVGFMQPTQDLLGL